MNGMREKIERLISLRNSMQERINARRRLRARRGGGELARLQREWVAVKEQLGRAMRNMRTVSEESGERMVARED